MEQVIMFMMPVWSGVLLFYFYANGSTSAASFIKLSGLLSLFLLSVTFAIGPLSYFFSFVNHLKRYRKYLGLVGFALALVHVYLAYITYYHSKLSIFYDISNPRYMAIFMGLLALVILFLLSVTANSWAIRTLGYKWKILQTTGYIALLAIMEHFILIETRNGIFGMKEPLEKIIFVLGFVVILIRFMVFLLTEYKPRK